MQSKNPLLPVLLLLFFPIPHILLVSNFVPDDQTTGFWQIGATVFLLMDGIFALSLLALLKLPSLRWKYRERGLMFVGCLLALLWLVGSKDAFGNSFFGGQLLVFILSVIWLNKQNHLKALK